MLSNPQPFKNIEYLTLCKNTNYYQLMDNIHIKEIFTINEDILCVYYLDKIKMFFLNDYIDYMYTNKITINNLVYDVNVRYITINEYSNELLVYYNVINH